MKMSLLSIEIENLSEQEITELSDWLTLRGYKHFFDEEKREDEEE